MALRFLSDKDAELLQELLDEHRKRRENAPSQVPTEHSWSQGEDHQAPEVYVAAPPSGGIPARTADTPGSATCDVYKIVGGDLVDADFDLLVYNISNQIIPRFDERCAADDYVNYVAITRTKFGFWITGVHDDSCPTDTETGTGTGVDCPTIPGVEFDTLDEDTDPSYVLGLDSSGDCLVKVPVSECSGT